MSNMKGVTPLPSGVSVIKNSAHLQAEDVFVPKTVWDALEPLVKLGLFKQGTGTLLIRTVVSRRTSIDNYSIQLGDAESAYIVPIETFASQILIFPTKNNKQDKSLRDFSAEARKRISGVLGNAQQKPHSRIVGRLTAFQLWFTFRNTEKLFNSYSDVELVKLSKLDMSLDKLIGLMEQGTDYQTIENFSGVPDSWVDAVFGDDIKNGYGTDPDDWGDAFKW